MKTLRIVFMGTPEFAVESLKALLATTHEVVGVITAPDKPAGRGKQIKASAVKEYALAKGLNVLQPTNLKDEEFTNELRSLKADLQIVVAFRMLPEVVWNMPPLGTINLHASLLPDYRGAAPINWAIINGEEKTGVTTFFLKHEIDTGDIIAQEEVNITNDDDAGTLHNKLMITGAKLLAETVNVVASGKFKQVPQAVNENPKHAPKIFKDDCKINWELPVEQIQNLVRGLSPYPAAWTTFKNNSGKEFPVKLFKSIQHKVNHDKMPGTIKANEEGMNIYCKSGYLEVKELQMSGKKRLPINDFLRGFNLQEEWFAT